MTNLTDEAPLKLLTCEGAVDESEVELHWFRKSGDVKLHDVRAPIQNLQNNLWFCKVLYRFCMTSFSLIRYNFKTSSRLFL
jgi:hypothetical protein